MRMETVLAGVGAKVGACLGWMSLALVPAIGQTAVNIKGTVTDSAGAPLAGVSIKLANLGTTTTTDAAGNFTLGGGTGIAGSAARLHVSPMALNEGRLLFELAADARVTVTALGVDGQVHGRVESELASGSHSLALPDLPSGLGFLRVSAGGETVLMRVLSVHGRLHQVGETSHVTEAGNPQVTARTGLAKASATAIYDEIVTEKTGFQKAYVSITSSDSAGMKIKMLKDGSTKFSFFVVSMASIKRLSGSENGFGGDLRFGETGPGAGLRGADKICRTVAEGSLPGSSVKGWRAFLSVTADTRGAKVDAISRIGEGPWYDRIGRLLAPKKADLLNTRPQNGDPTIQNSLPNENGIDNKFPDPNQTQYDDNHHMLTGSSTTGTLKSATATCKDWTVAEAKSEHGKPGVGFAWIRGGGFGGGGGGGQAQGAHWMSTYDAHGCGAGIEIIETGPGDASVLTVGSGGGYGGFYCFALNP